jgi:hypothetical protein
MAARSRLMPLGMTTSIRYPFTAPTMLNALPVLPLLASTMVSPGWSSPSRSARSTIQRAIRALMEPEGFRNSSLVQMPSISMRGVPPIASRIVRADPDGCLLRSWLAVGTATSQLRMRRISGSKRGSGATVAGCRSAKYWISTCVPGPDSSGGSQA